MIPFWLLTILHYASLAAAILILGLLAWQGLSSQNGDSPTGITEAANKNDSTENG